MFHSTVDLIEQTSNLATRLWLASLDKDRPALEALTLKNAARAVRREADNLFSNQEYLGKFAPEHAGDDPQHAPTP